MKKKIDVYSLIKNNDYKHTKVVSSEKEYFVNLKGKVFIPDDISSMEFFDKFFSYGEKMKFENIQTHHKKNKKEILSERKRKGFEHPIKHTSSSGTIYSSEKHKYQNRKKVIVSYSGYLSPEYDECMGTTHLSHLMLVSSEEEAETIINLLGSDIYKFVIESSKFDGGWNDLKLLNCLPYISDIKSFDNNSILTKLNLNDWIIQ